MFGLGNIFSSGKELVANSGNNFSIILSGINNGQPIPITLTQASDPWQFWISTGVALITGAGILALPILLGSGGNPIKKARSIKEFNKLTGRPSLIISHKPQLFKQQMIDQKTTTDILNAMARLNGQDFNIIIESGGGHVFHSLLIADAMSKYKGKIHVYVSRFAMSGASLLSLAATDLHLSDYASLGPIDPQLGSILSQGSAKGWEEVVKLKGIKANDQSIMHSLTGAQVTKTMKEYIYNFIKNKTAKAKEVSEFLTSGTVEHIFQIKKSKLLEMGFNNIYDITSQENRLITEMVG